MRRLPWALVVLRLALGPALAALLLLRVPWTWTVGALAVAVLSDVFDGVLARRLGVATERLRRADSVVDTVFYVFVAAASVVVYPGTFRAYATGLLLVVALEVARYAVDVTKYGRPAAYHMWSAKLWGLTLLAGFAELFASGQGGVLFGVAVVVGVLTNVEGLGASVLLREWRHDVPSLPHALRVRQAEGSRPRPASE